MREMRSKHEAVLSDTPVGGKMFSFTSSATQAPSHQQPLSRIIIFSHQLRENINV